MSKFFKNIGYIFIGFKIILIYGEKIKDTFGN